MHHTRAWLFAFKRAFRANEDSPPPNDEDMLSLLRLADERGSEADPDVDEEPPPPPRSSRH